MKKEMGLFISIAVLAICGCSSIQANKLNRSSMHQDFFSYEADLTGVQAPVAIGGKLIKKNECILFETEDGKLITPVFPLQLTKYDKVNERIVLGNTPIEFGKKIIVGGDIITPNYRTKYTTKGLATCMKDKIAVLNSGISISDIK